MQAEQSYVDKRGAARFTALSVRKLDYARESGALPFYKVGKKVVYRTADLDAYMNRFRVAVGGAA